MRLLLGLIMAAGLLVGCTSEEAVDVPTTELERSEPVGAPPFPTESELVSVSLGGVCGDVFFWAATPDGSTAVAVTHPMYQPRLRGEAESIYVTVGDGATTVEILRGTDLPRNFCTDMVWGESEPTEILAATEGAGTMTLDPSPVNPRGSCPGVAGQLVLEGLVAEDGTRFDTITVDAVGVGCSPG